METIKQPLNLNHEGKTIPEILGIELSDIESMTESSEMTDEKFALTLLGVLFTNPKSAAIMSVLLGSVLGRDFDKISELVEYFTNTITSEEERNKIIRFAIHSIGDKE